MGHTTSRHRNRGLSQPGLRRRGRVPLWPADVRDLRRLLGSDGRSEHEPDRRRAEQPAQVRGIDHPRRSAVHGDVATAVRDLKVHQDGTLLVPGSGALVRWLLANDLVDQLDLLTYPVVIGQGTRLFPDSGPDVALDLVNSRTTSRGITIQTYRPVGRPEYVTTTVDPEHVMRDATTGRRS